jgi:magnesium-transporting ATPase (P-type)
MDVGRTAAWESLFSIYTNFDMTYLFDYTYILMFNLFFTSIPVAIMGVLDQDVSDAVSLAVPQLYRRGIERLEWTQKKFWLVSSFLFNFFKCTRHLLLTTQ